MFGFHVRKAKFWVAVWHNQERVPLGILLVILRL